MPAKRDLVLIRTVTVRQEYHHRYANRREAKPSVIRKGTPLHEMYRCCPMGESSIDGSGEIDKGLAWRCGCGANRGCEQGVCYRCGDTDPAELR